MRKTNCEAIRRELDELLLGDESSASAVEHLRECPDCQEFHQKQTKLRKIVGSLRTIQAPADFDFRLRARLANESNGAAYHLRSAYWSFARGGFAAAAALVLLFGGLLAVRHFVNQQGGVEVSKKSPIPQPLPTEMPRGPSPQQTLATVPDNGGSGFLNVKSERTPQNRPRMKRSMTAVDFSNKGAQVITAEQPHAGFGAPTVFPIDASLQSLRVSLDDGRGNARTISVPTISFGSRRLLPNGNQFAPRGIW